MLPRLARCLTPRTFYATACSHKHAFRATGTFTMTSSTFPGAEKIAPSQPPSGRVPENALWRVLRHTTRLRS